MIIIDTNIISTFCRINKLTLIFKLFPNDTFGITPAVYDEMMEAIRLGYSFLKIAKSLVDKNDLQLISLKPDELQLKQTLPRSFGSGDLECIVVSKKRKYELLTNDKRIINYCKLESITVYDLPIILRAFWENGICSKKEVHRMIDEIENKENMVIKNKKFILTD